MRARARDKEREIQTQHSYERVRAPAEKKRKKRAKERGRRGESECGRGEGNLKYRHATHDITRSYTRNTSQHSKLHAQNITHTQHITALYTAGWRRPTGCLKLQVSFRKRATNYRALLRKMTCKDKASYDSTPLCTPGWRRVIGCLMLRVIFCKRATDYRALLRKMTYEDKASYDSTPLCTHTRDALRHSKFHTRNP